MLAETVVESFQDWLSDEWGYDLTLEPFLARWAEEQAINTVGADYGLFLQSVIMFAVRRCRVCPAPEIDAGDFGREALVKAGFVGFVPFAKLPSAGVSVAGGVYVVLRASREVPDFLEESPAGTHKGRTPTVAVEVLRRQWVAGAAVVYIGKATSLNERLNAYRRQGTGGKARHFGGRYIWQLADSVDLIVAWRETRGIPRDVEKELLRAFRTRYGSLPFANLQ